MIFTAELGRKVLAGEKTVTRRLCSENPRSPWWQEECHLRPGSVVSVQLGRSKPGIGKLRVCGVTRQKLGALTDAEARCEGFADAASFAEAWSTINGSYEQDALVWRVEFEVIR